MPKILKFSVLASILKNIEPSFFPLRLELTKSFQKSESVCIVTIAALESAFRLRFNVQKCRICDLRSLCLQTSSKALEQEVRERATVLQTEFENFVHSDAQSLQAAKKGEVAAAFRANMLAFLSLLFS